MRSVAGDFEFNRIAIGKQVDGLYKVGLALTGRFVIFCGYHDVFCVAGQAKDYQAAEESIFGSRSHCIHSVKGILTLIVDHSESYHKPTF